jgi:hypothetical protein
LAISFSTVSGLYGLLAWITRLFLIELRMVALERLNEGRDVHASGLQ